MTSPLGALPGAATTIDQLTGGQSAKTATPAGGNLGKDAFLKLLVAQLKYQDPNNPTDGSAFLSQTAQFTQVEKLDALATVQNNLLSAQLSATASGLVGHTVTYTGIDGKEAVGVVTSAVISGSSPTLKVGNTDVPLSSVKEVRNHAG
jgi:flagellar basal-body rod modification protein FlgD